VVFGIVTNHEGFIELISEPAHGSTFNMYFPLRQQAPQDSDTVGTSLSRGEMKISREVVRRFFSLKTRRSSYG
jgi:hypothetical protein